MKFKTTKKTLSILCLLGGLSMLSFNILKLQSNADTALKDNWWKYGPNTPKITKYIQSLKMRKSMETMFHAGDPTLMLLKDHVHSESCGKSCSHSKQKEEASAHVHSESCGKSCSHSKQKEEASAHVHSESCDKSCSHSKQKEEASAHVHSESYDHKTEKKDTNWIKVTPIFYIPQIEITKLDKTHGKVWRAQTKESQGESNKILVKRLTKYQKRDPFQIWLYHDIAYFCVNFFFKYELSLKILNDGWESWNTLLQLAQKYPEELQKNGRMIQLRAAQMDAAQLCLLGMWNSKDSKQTKQEKIWEDRFTTIAENYKYTFLKTKEHLELKGENTDNLKISDVIPFKKGAVDNLTFTLYTTTWSAIKPMVLQKIK